MVRMFIATMRNLGGITVKKLLSILALVLVACTLCAVALAADDVNDSVKPEELLSRIHDYAKDGHELVNPRKVADITCTTPEIWRFDCMIDGKLSGHFHEIRVGEPLGHDLEITATDPSPMVCREPAKVTYTCTRCDYTETKEETLDHLWSADVDSRNWGIVIVQPTCEYDKDPYYGRGIAADYCLRCGAIHYWSLDDDDDTNDESEDNTLENTWSYKNRELAPVGHKWTIAAWTEEPCCLNGNMTAYVRKCSVCGVYENGMDKDTAIEDVLADENALHTATREEAIILNTRWQYTFKVGPAKDHVCDSLATYLKEHDADGHWWDNWAYEDEEPTGVGAKCAPRHAMHGCKLCAEKQEKVLQANPKWVTLHLTKEAQNPDIENLEDCYNTVQIKVCENCFDWDAWKLDSTKALEEYITYHGLNITKIKRDAHAHEYDWEHPLDYTAPTCTEPGQQTVQCIHYDEDSRHANDEDAVITVEIEPLGHIYGEWVLRVEKNANGGDNEYAYWLHECIRCGQTEERLFDGEGTPTDLDGEVHEYKLVEDVPATCEEWGHKYYEDQANEGEGYWENIAPTGHDLKVTITKPGCETEGTRTQYCANCGMSETETIPATGHKVDPKARIILTEPTCTTAGEALDICTVCSKSFKTALPATGHTFGDVETETSADCVNEGKGVKTCTVCGAKEEVVLPKLSENGAHSYQPVEGKPASCTEAGYDQYVECTVCGDQLIAKKEIPALGHDYVTKAGTPATCTEAGTSDSEVCSRCGDVKTPATEVPALGHDYDEGVVIAEPDYGVAGEIKYTCKVCGDTYTEPYGEPKELEDPAYTVAEINANGGVISGKLEQVENTKEAQVYIRVTAYFGDNDRCGIWMVPVAADGSFFVSTNGASQVDLAFTFDADAAQKPEFDAFEIKQF